MKRHVLASLVMVFVLLFSFQNCQKTPFPDEINGQNFNSTNQEKVDLSSESMESINFLIEATDTINHPSGHTYQVKYFKNLQIDLVTGIILESSDLNSNTANYCLTDELREELVHILSASQVCTTQPDIPANTVCTQVMKTPYAQLVTLKQQFDLGSASNGCGSNSVDLCGEQANLLKGYMISLKQQYQQLSCQ